MEDLGKVFDQVVDYAYREETNLYKASDLFLTQGEMGCLLWSPVGYRVQ